jgi:hypothetical protein
MSFFGRRRAARWSGSEIKKTGLCHVFLVLKLHFRVVINADKCDELCPDTVVIFLKTSFIEKVAIFELLQQV